MPKVSSPPQLATVAPQRRRTVPAEPDDTAGSRFGRLEVVADLAPVALAGFDARLVCTGANPRFAELVGGSPGGVLGRRWPDLLPQLGEDGHRLVEAVVRGARPSATLELHRGGIWRLHLYPLALGRDQAGAGLVGEDVTADVARLRELARLATCDGLTGLLNRSAFHARLADAVAEAGGTRRFTVVVVDLDGFKAVNDTYGHVAGDAVLAEVGERLRSVLGDDDVAGRVGGDEFAVLSRSGGRRRAAALASRVQRVLDAPVALGAAGRVQVTATVGHAVVDGSLTATQAFAAADDDMYARKWAGRALGSGPGAAAALARSRP